MGKWDWDSEATVLPQHLLGNLFSRGLSWYLVRFFGLLQGGFFWNEAPILGRIMAGKLDREEPTSITVSISCIK